MATDSSAAATPPASTARIPAEHGTPTADRGPSVVRTPPSTSHQGAGDGANSPSTPSAAHRFSGSQSALGAASPPSSPPSILRSIAARFDSPTVDLCADPTRVLIREGAIERQAILRKVWRYCYLFNDCKQQPSRYEATILS
jgi:hypothetical protein